MYKTFKTFIFISNIVNFFLAMQLSAHGFGPHTQIYISPQETVAIQVLCEDQLDENQKVLSFDQKRHKSIPKKVTGAATVQTDRYYAIQCNNESHEEIICTPDQLFYVYINAIFSLMACLEINELGISDLENYRRSMLRRKNGNKISNGELKSVLQMILRNYIWAKLKAPTMYVHFGNDYYLYIGCAKHCQEALKTITDSGLFVEECDSPYNMEL